MNRRPTMAEIIRTERDRMNRSLFARAGDASRIAKLTGGRSRRLAYDVKHHCLDQLIERGEALVTVDTHRCPGLLSVGIDRRLRLHTHENWLKAARAR